MELAVYRGTASVMVPGFGARRSRELSSQVPRSQRAAPVTDWSAAVGRDFPELVVRGAVERSPSPDGPLAIGFVS